MLSKRLWSLLILDPIYYVTNYWIDDFFDDLGFWCEKSEIEFNMRNQNHISGNEQKKGWNDFEWIWMVRNEPCLNIFVTKTQQIRFNPTQGTKPAGSSWIFINVPDLW